MEHLTFKGTADYPSSRAISEAVEGVGGSFNAATDRESTVYWVRVPAPRGRRARCDVLGELIVRPRLDERRDRPRADVIVEEIRSYLDDPSEYAQILFQQAMFGDGPLGREICGDEDGIRACPGRDPRRSGSRRTARPTPSSRSPATSTTRAAVELAAARLRARQRRRARLRAGAGAAGGRARARPAGATPTQAQLVVGVPGAPAGPPRRLDPGGAQRGPRRRDEQPPVPRRARGRPRLRRQLGIVEYADAGALEISAGVDPDAPARRRSRRSSSSWPAAGRAGARAGAGEGEARTSRAAWSCGWRRRATSRRGSVARRRCTTAS